jgi:hypothetical protein
MSGINSQRPFLPQQLMNPTMGSMSFPWGGGSRLPEKPNPLTQPAPARTVKADAAGIQQAMAKRAENLGLGRVPQGAGPQQMFNAMSMLGQARALVDPGKTLKQERLSRPDFEGKLDELSKKDGDKYDFSSMRQSPKNQAILKGLLGALAGGGIGYLGGGGIGSTLGGAALGGAGGAGMGALGAKNENRKLLSTAKVLKDYGLLRPEYLRQALPLLKQSAQDNSKPRLSETGSKSGVTYKYDTQGHATGASAFDTLDGYMKKAGLNSFQTQFFSKLLGEGMNAAQIRVCVKEAHDRFGEKIGNELTAGLAELEKTAYGTAVGRFLGWAGGKLLPRIPAAVKSLAGRAPSLQTLKNVGNMKVTDAAKNVATAAGNTARAAPGVAKQVLTGPGARSQMITGAGTGAFNPYTGLGSGNIYDEEGFHGGRLLANMAGGALLGRVPGAQNMMRRGLAGEGLGYAAAKGGNLAGSFMGEDSSIGQGLRGLDPLTMARGGFLGGAMIPGQTRLGNIPGLGGLKSNGPAWSQKLFNSPVANKAGTGWMQKLDPIGIGVRAAGRGAKGVGSWAVNNPASAMGGTAALLGGGAVVDTAMNTVPELLNSKADEMKATLLKEMRSNLDDFRPQVDDTLAAVRDAANGVGQTAKSINGLADGTGWGDMVGGEGGWGGILSGLMSGEGGGMAGNIGSYLKNNPWLLPLLLSGAGAGGGYALGGGGGAALGGIGAPLLYALATGQFGGTGGGQNAASEKADQQRRADENAAVSQGINNPVAGVPQPTQMLQENEIQRQRDQAGAPAQG